MTLKKGSQVRIIEGTDTIYIVQAVKGDEVYATSEDKRSGHWFNRYELKEVLP